MTFGIDISVWQKGIDLARAVEDGTEFVIVKALAQFGPGYTVAEEYQAHIDAAIAAGLGGAKGHYAAPHAAFTPEAAAEALLTNLHRFELGDVLALNNEPLGDYGTFWTDADAARWFRHIHELTGHPFDRMWLYFPAHLTRRHGPWPECEALGIRRWWVAYGSQPTGQAPDHEPSLQGSLTGWDVHQFTDRSSVAGMSVDGNYSPLAVTDLFGGDQVSYLSHRPAKGNMNQGFGPRPKPTASSPSTHYGQDYGWGGGDAIYAARAGRVKAYASSGSYGNRLIIDHGGGRETWYCHLNSSLVSVGAQVDAGQHVAQMGATGNVTAKHLHFELRINGTANDPEPYFATGSTAGGIGTPIEEDEMSAEAERKINALFAGVFGARNETGKETPITWVEYFGGARSSRYGLLDVVLHNQTLLAAATNRLAEQAGQIAGLSEIVKQLAARPGQPVDIGPVVEALKAETAAFLEKLPPVEIDYVRAADAVADEIDDRARDRLNGQ